MPWPTSALIVDDEPHIRTYLRLILKELGIETHYEAGDGVEALAMMGQYAPEFVVLDLHLPVMGGLEVLEKIREVAPDVPVVIMTSHTSGRGVQESVRLGALAYILKHMSRDETIAEIREALEDYAGDADVDAENSPG